MFFKNEAKSTSLLLAKCLYAFLNLKKKVNDFLKALADQTRPWLFFPVMNDKQYVNIPLEPLALNSNQESRKHEP